MCNKEEIAGTEVVPEISATSYEPPAATVAALEFQVACLVNDRLSTVNCLGSDLVVNKPGDLLRKHGTLLRIAKRMFPKRGDCEDVLSETIVSYGLLKWADPSRFWMAFRHDMIDAKKSAFEAKRLHIERAESSGSDRTRQRGNSHVWTESAQSLAIDNQTARQWHAEHWNEIHATEPSASEKWQTVQASEDPLDQLIRDAMRLVQADEDYMDGLSKSKAPNAKSTRLVAAIQCLTGRSQADAYRVLKTFKQRHSSRNNKS